MNQTARIDAEGAVWDDAVVFESYPLNYNGRRLENTVCRSTPPLDGEALRAAASILSAPERTRADRFYFVADRAAYITAHALLRRTLSDVAGHTSPAGWAFEATPAGRPFLSRNFGDTALDFNLSHSRGRVAVLVSQEARCGVDVERIGRVENPSSLADSVFSGVEIDAVRGTADERERHERFTALWSLREAYLKATGTGLSVRLDNFYFRVDRFTGSPAEVVLPPGADAGSWTFTLFRPDSDHFLAAALCFE